MTFTGFVALSLILIPFLLGIYAGIREIAQDWRDINQPSDGQPSDHAPGSEP